MITSGKNLLHWNYFIALESDLDDVSRYIEFAEENFATYSIELAHLLLAATSEIDVVAKGLCAHLDSTKSFENIYDYQEMIMGKSDINPAQVAIYCPKYGLTLEPWSNWTKPKNPPDWWNANNNVKHHRNEHFKDANLKNALNAVAALMALNFCFYMYDLDQRLLSLLIDTLQPAPKLMKWNDLLYRNDV